MQSPTSTGLGVFRGELFKQFPCFGSKFAWISYANRIHLGSHARTMHACFMSPPGTAVPLRKGRSLFDSGFVENVQGSVAGAHVRGRRGGGDAPLSSKRHVHICSLQMLQKRVPYQHILPLSELLSPALKKSRCAPVSRILVITLFVATFIIQ